MSGHQLQVRSKGPRTYPQKSFIPTERDEAERAKYLEDVDCKDAKQLVFIDETSAYLGQGSVLVMDNWTVHHGDDVRDLVEACGCELLYLPTYSPDLNPTEHLFAKLKAFIKALRPDSTDKLVQASCNAVKLVTPEQVLNTFLHCGYSLEQ